MGKRRRKHRTHVKAPADGAGDGGPKSFIIKHGQVGHSLAQLVRDLRKVMEPHTASRLKERTRNKLKDYITLAPALHVTHLLALTLSPVAPSLRLIRLSAGPTLVFRIERYSLMKDILNTKRRARSMGLEYLSPPLLVLASFPSPSPSTPPHLSLLMKSFQSMFPPLSPQTLSLSNARRVVLVSYIPERETVEFRHYLITIKPYGVSRRVRKVFESAKSSTFLDLGKEQDVADFVLRRKGESEDGYESAVSSASSAAGDDGDAVSLAGDYVGRNNKRGQRRAVRLDEIGPRMELRLVKITEGIPGKEGEVLYHRFVKKSRAEVKSQKAAHAEKERLRKERREEQERNVARKKQLREGKGKGKDAEEDSDDEVDDQEEQDFGKDGDDMEDDEVGWDDEEEISEGEESDVADEETDGDESEEEPPPPAPPSRPKKRSKGKH